MCAASGADADISFDLCKLRQLFGFHVARHVLGGMDLTVSQ
jgi:hypothetical protein